MCIRGTRVAFIEVYSSLTSSLAEAVVLWNSVSICIKKLSYHERPIGDTLRHAHYGVHTSKSHMKMLALFSEIGAMSSAVFYSAAVLGVWSGLHPVLL